VQLRSLPVGTGSPVLQRDRLQMHTDAEQCPVSSTIGVCAASAQGCTHAQRCSMGARNKGRYLHGCCMGGCPAVDTIFPLCSPILCASSQALCNNFATVPSCLHFWQRVGQQQPLRRLRQRLHHLAHEPCPLTVPPHDMRAAELARWQCPAALTLQWSDGRVRFLRFLVGLCCP
jgi:hypothetical protein